MKDSLYSIPEGCICMGDGMLGMPCTATSHATLKEEKPKMTDEEARLTNIVEAHKKALHHWRQKADLDYVQMQRLYNALEGARTFIVVHGGDPALLNEIDDATAGVEFMPPKVFV